MRIVKQLIQKEKRKVKKVKVADTQQVFKSVFNGSYTRPKVIRKYKKIGE